ncbi:hypothetical protein [Streptomyces lavendofoliae]|uniref:hypothetical protein n=1 Tax=Streptomyces lavendofoliae TaxID=67314 RepID=UPI00167424E2|nr:hypothetical protein [Streptomyces lavendofoliae]
MAVDSGRNQDVLVGIKPRAQVEAAHQRLAHKAATPGLRTPFSLGAVSAYEWALGRASEAPVTGAAGTGRVPSSHLLTAELDAAVVQLGDPTQSAEGAAHVRGVHDALAWVCGLIDEQP